MERGLEMVVGVLGVVKAGGAYLPLDPSYPLERLGQMLEDAAPRIVLSQSGLLGVLPPSAAKVVALDEKLPQIGAFQDENIAASELRLSPQNLVYVIYTSGSTGRPKGTAMGHRSMVNLIEWHRRTFGSGEGRRVLQFAALSFDVAFQEIFSTLCTGGALVFIDEWVRRDARALTEVLQRHSVERLFTPPLMLQSLAEHRKSTGEVPAHLKDVITAGEQLRVSAEIRDFFRQLPGARLHNHYGPTETHVVTALTLEGDPGTWPDLPAIGHPIANTQIYVLDAYRQPVPIGVSGEVYIGGVNVARGYLNRPELTEQRFVADPFSNDPQARLYKTGDLGRWRADGTLEYLGRNDDQVKIRGYRIELGDIEAQLLKHSHVKQAAVVVREDVPTQKRLVSYVVPRDQHVPGMESLRRHLKATLPNHMVPSAFVVLKALPVTPTGKIDRKSLPMPGLSAYASEIFEAPRNGVEASLAAIWRKLLNIELVGRNDNFFELGGHSLLATRLVDQIEKALGRRITVATVFRSPTLLEMAEELSAPPTATSLGPVAGRSTTTGTRRANTAPLAYTQAQHWNLYQLGKRPSFRFVVCAVHLRGDLDARKFSECVNMVVARHDSLRTVFRLRGGTPVQEVDERLTANIRILDSERTRASMRELTIVRNIEQAVLEPIWVAAGPLIETRLLRFSGDDHVLIVAAEHMICDGSSLRILLSELSLSYEHVINHRPIKLPEVPVQFPEYATLQRSEERAWAQGHASYWNGQLMQLGRLRFPADRSFTEGVKLGWGIAPIEISEEIRLRLQALSRQVRSTPILVAFTAYVALVLRWCHSVEGVILFMSDGREDMRLRNTCGYFAAPLYIYTKIEGGDSFLDLLGRLTTGYSNAYQHADHSYLEAQLPRPEIAKNTVFNWIPRLTGKDSSEYPASKGRVVYSQLAFDLPFLHILERDSEPMVVLYETESGISGGVYFPRDRFSFAGMTVFANNFVAFIEHLLQDPEREVLGVPITAQPYATASALEAGGTRGKCLSLHEGNI